MATETIKKNINANQIPEPLKKICECQMPLVITNDDTWMMFKCKRVMKCIHTATYKSLPIKMKKFIGKNTHKMYNVVNCDENEWMP